MSKKMHRCPHCGQKSFMYLLTMDFRGIRSLENLDYNAPVSFSKNFSYYLKCKHCEGKSNIYTAKGQVFGDLIYFLCILILLSLVGSLIMLKGLTMYTAVAAAVVLMNLPIWYYLSCRNNCLIPLDDSDGRQTLLKIKSNCRVRLNDSKYIRKMWVYGLKFSTETKNIKFKERFTDGLVPAQFYPAKDGSNEFEIRIIGREFVPDEVLFEGAEFLVEDIDGIFICKGKITKLDLEF